MIDAEGHNRKMQELPIWEKPLLTVVEAAKYFQIGESNIRRLTREHKDQDFVLWKDNRVYIQRNGVVFRHNQRDIGGKELWQKKAR